MTRRRFILASAALASGLLAGRSLAQNRTMLTRAIPSTAQQVPVVGMGTWQTFDPPAIDEASLAPLREVLRIFHEAGGRVIDSSPMYGKSEDVTSKLSHELGINDELFIATKVWTSGRQAGIDQMRQSIKLLGRQRIELMQVHNLVDYRTHIETLRDWKAQGVFRYIGATHYQVGALDQLERIIRDEQLDFVQLPYSLATRDAEKRLLPAARDHNVAVLVNRPFEQGQLFRAVRDKPLPDFAKRFATSWAQAFLKFILANPAVTCVIPATSNPKHMRDNVEAGFDPLPDQNELTRLVAAIS